MLIVSEKGLGWLLIGLGLLIAGFCAYGLLAVDLKPDTKSMGMKLLAGGIGMMVMGAAFLWFIKWKDKFHEKMRNRE